MFQKRRNDIDIEGFVNSDYAGDRDYKKSTTAFYFLVYGNCVSWKSQLQSVVSLSTTEAKYMATTEAIKEGVWIQGLLQELGLFKGVTTVFSDSQSAVRLCKSSVFHNRTKHVEVRYHFIRDKVTEGVIRVEKVPTEENPVDFSTKVVTLNKFNHFLNLLGIEDVKQKMEFEL